MFEIDAKDLENFNADLLIDARSPREFLNSHIKNAQNFYALNDYEYAKIGIIYKNISKSQARILGASYVCKNASNHILKIEKTVPIGSKIAIYCSRGGQRSNSIGLILSQIGFNVAKIKGGYKALRNEILSFIENKFKLDFITLFGLTGSGKSELIERLNPSLDLEKLANHLGSSFGEINGHQPNAKTFQNNLFAEFKRLEKYKLCFVEGESKRIGKIILPSRLYEKMTNSIGVYITSPMECRVDRIVRVYQSISDEYFFECMQKITPYIQKSAKEDIVAFYKKKDLKSVAFLLLENYYDKVYKKPKNINYMVKFEDDIEKTLKELKDIYETIL